MSNYTKVLSVELTHEEIEATAKELAELVVKKGHLEDQKKSVTQSYKESIDDLKEDIDHLSQTIITRSKEKNVECRDEYNPISKRMDIYRNDLNIVIGSRDCTPEELQKEFRFVESLNLVQANEPEMVQG